MPDRITSVQVPAGRRILPPPPPAPTVLEGMRRTGIRRLVAGLFLALLGVEATSQAVWIARRLVTSAPSSR